MHKLKNSLSKSNFMSKKWRDELPYKSQKTIYLHIWLMISTVSLFIQQSAYFYYYLLRISTISLGFLLFAYNFYFLLRISTICLGFLLFA